MNFKTNKDIIIRVVKHFVGVTAVGTMILLICMILFAESVIFSKEVVALLIGIAIFCLGIGGLISAIFIFFSYCMNRISKLEKIIADRDKTIATQHNQLQKVNAYMITRSDSKVATTKSVSDTSENKIFREIAPLSDEVAIDESLELEAESSYEPEPILPQDSPATEDA